MTVRDYLTEEVTIESASIEDSRDGDRWKMMVQIPSMRSNYPTGPIWKKVEDGERIKTGDKVVCKLVRGKLKTPGAYEDADFGYYWELSEWATSDAPTVSTASNGTSNAAPTPQSGDTLAQRIAWNSAINNAVTLFSHSEIRKDDWLDVLDYEKIKHIAGRVYNMILAGPPQDEPEPVYRDPRDGPEATEMPVQPVPAPVASKLQRPPAKSSDAKLKELDEARTDTKGIEICSADAVVQYIASNYDERGPRDLTEAEVNQVIDAIRGGYVRDPEPVDVAQLPF